jgi:hypothetical protein
MRKMIVVTSVVLAAAFLGGCAGNGLAGGSPLPSASQSLMHRVHSAGEIGGGPPAISPHGEIGGGPPAISPHGEIGGGPPAISPHGEIGGGPGTAAEIGGGPGAAHAKAHRLAEIGGGPATGKH